MEGLCVEILVYLAFHDRLPLRPELLDALDRGEQDLERHVDEVDVGHRDRDVAREDDPVVDGAVDEIQEGDLPGLDQGLAHAHGSSSVGAVKLYGSQGPLYSQWTPSRSSTQERSSAWKVSAFVRRTRKAARRISISPWTFGV